MPWRSICEFADILYEIKAIGSPGSLELRAYFSVASTLALVDSVGRGGKSVDTILQAAPAHVAVAVPKTKLYEEVGAILRDSLSKRGCEVSLVCDGDPLALRSDLLFLAGDAEHFNGFRKLLNKRQQRPETIFWHMEPLPPPSITPRAEELSQMLADCTWDERLPRGLVRSLGGWPWKLRRKHYASQFRNEMRRNAHQNWDNVQAPNLAYVVRQRNWLLDPVQRRWIDHLYCTTPPRARYLADRGLQVPYIHLGCHPLFGQRLEAERDIDVLFLGSVHKTRRRLALDQICKALDRQGITLQIVDRNCFGMERTRLLNRAKIVINLVKFPWDFPGMRLLMSAACGALVVSDTCEETTPFVAGEHFVPATIERMPAVVSHYLKSASKRQSIVECAYEFVTRELTIDQSLSKILEHVSSKRRRRLAA